MPAMIRWVLVAVNVALMGSALYLKVVSGRLSSLAVNLYLIEAVPDEVRLACVRFTDGLFWPAVALAALSFLVSLSIVEAQVCNRAANLAFLAASSVVVLVVFLVVP
jgi:hypothetical protein